MKNALVAVSGYGDCAPWYICTDNAYTDDEGYEQIWSFIAPCEEYLKKEIQEIILQTFHAGGISS